MTHPAPDWQALRAAIAGKVVVPGSPGYDSARKPAMARFYDARPQAIVSVRDSRGRLRDDLVRQAV